LWTLFLWFVPENISLMFFQILAFIDWGIGVIDLWIVRTHRVSGSRMGVLKEASEQTAFKMWNKKTWWLIMVNGD
jgi:hypothetical protein